MAYDINEDVTGSPVLTDNVRPSSHPPIKINNNEEFASFVSEKGLHGEGTEDNPYLLQDYYINGSLDGCCIYIGNTTEYFILSESHLYGASEEGPWPNNRATGIIFYNVTNGIISNNSISDNDYGITLINSHINKIMNNIVSHNLYGIQICLSTHNVLHDNQINENDIRGIDLISSSQNFIINNTVSNNSYGIYCTQSGPEIYGTMISGSDYAVYLDQSASYIKDCRFEGNVNGLYNIGEANDYVINMFSSVHGTETASFIDGGIEESFGITLPKRALIKSVNLTVEGEGYGNEALTEDSASQMCPALYKNWLVWQDKRDGNWDIYAYDLSMDSDCNGIPNYLERPKLENDPSLQCITNNSAIQMKPDIWGDTIVWTDLRHGNYDVYAYSFSNKTEWAVTCHPSAQWRTSVFGDHIVWSDLRNGNYDVYMLNISKNEVSRLSFSERNDLCPKIFKDRVVWYSYSGSPGGSEYSDIHLFDISSWKLCEITTDNAIQYCPDIDDNNVVWHDNRHGNWEIYKLDLKTMQEERITSDPEQKFCPRINQNRISYYFHDRIKDIWSVRMYDLESGVQRIIEAETDGDSHPVVYGSRIAWVNKSDAKNDIYVLDDNITGIPRDVHLDVGCDGDPEFYHEKEFEGMAYADERALLSGLKNFMSDEAAGNVKVPIRLSFNGTGSVSLGPLEIVYDLPTIVSGSSINNCSNYGIYCLGSSPQIINTTLYGNHIDLGAYTGSRPLILNSTIPLLGNSIYDSTSCLLVENFLHMRVENVSGAPLNANLNVQDNGRVLFDDAIGEDGRLEWLKVTYAIYDMNGKHGNITIANVSLGTYQFDNNPRQLDMWTSHWELFTTDITPPTVSMEFPPADWTCNRLDPEISIHVTDNVGVNISSLRLYVQGFAVYYDHVAVPGGYNISYHHDWGFYDGEGVNCWVIGEDMHGNKVEFSWEFGVDLRAKNMTISLQTGWNLISIPFEPHNTSIKSVLGSIDGCYDVARRYEAAESGGSWVTYSIYKPAILNDLSEINTTHAIWLHVTENCTLYVSGILHNSTSIPLYAGWNLVGYPTLTDTMNIGCALWGTGADKVEVCDMTQPYNLREASSIDIMRPGEGYWVHVPADTIWVVDW